MLCAMDTIKRTHLRLVKKASVPMSVCRFLGDCPYYCGGHRAPDADVRGRIESYCLNAAGSRACIRHRLRSKYGSDIGPSAYPA